MNKNYKVACLILLGFIIILSGCGGLEGAPGADSGDTGILIESVSIIGEEPAGGDNEIDVALYCCTSDPITGLCTAIEPGLFIANATLDIQVSPVAFDPFPASVEECTVTYLKGNENPDAPIIENLTVYPNCTILDGFNQCNVVMMDVDRKVKFWDDLNDLSPSMIRPVHFIARYQCGYVNVYGDSGSFSVEYDIWLDNWNYC